MYESVKKSRNIKNKFYAIFLQHKCMWCSHIFEIYENFILSPSGQNMTTAFIDLNLNGVKEEEAKISAWEFLHIKKHMREIEKRA